MLTFLGLAPKWLLPKYKVNLTCVSEEFFFLKLTDEKCCSHNLVEEGIFIKPRSLHR